jgi:dienelactone hydrolase
VIQNMAAGNFAKVENQYDARMAAALPTGKLAGAWASITTQFGAFQSIESAQTSQVQTYNVVKMVVAFERGKLDATVTYDAADGKIGGIVFRPHTDATAAATPSAAAWQPPNYAKQSSFTEKPLELTDQGYTLPGTLTLPNGPGPFPAVVLVHGSGPHDEDETIGPNKPFKDLAWGLASRGIAVYRYTKRTGAYGEKSAADPKLITVKEETIDDARAAVALVAKQPGINPEQVFLVGHSLGAFLAPRIATGNASLAGIVLMAANSKPLEKVIVEQVQYLTRTSDGTPSSAAADAQKAADQIESPALKPDDEVPLLGSKTYGAYWLDLRDYNPVKTAQKLKIPILVLQGGRDYQVTPDNFKDWQSGLGKRSNATLKFFPAANHLFIFGEGAPSPQDYEQAGHVNSQVIDAIAAFVLPSQNPGSLRNPGSPSTQR